MLEQNITLEEPRCQNKYGVRGYEFYITYRRRQRVYHRHCYDAEQISHFPHRHRLGAVTDNSEDGKQSERKADLQFHSAQEINHEEDADAYKHESEIIVAPLAFRIIQAMNHDPYHRRVERKPQQHCHEVITLNKRHAKQV